MYSGVKCNGQGEWNLIFREGEKCLNIGKIRNSTMLLKTPTNFVAHLLMTSDRGKLLLGISDHLLGWAASEAAALGVLLSFL